MKKTNNVPRRSNVKKRVAHFCRDNPSFTESQVRFWIHNSENNGLAKFDAIHHVGRSVFVDEDRIFAWIESNPPGRNQPAVER